MSGDGSAVAVVGRLRQAASLSQSACGVGVAHESAGPEGAEEKAGSACGAGGAGRQAGQARAGAGAAGSERKPKWTRAAHGGGEGGGSWCWPGRRMVAIRTGESQGGRWGRRLVVMGKWRMAEWSGAALVGADEG